MRLVADFLIQHAEAMKAAHPEYADSVFVAARKFYVYKG